VDWYYYTALVVIPLQLYFLTLMYRNYRYTLVKYNKKRIGYWRRTVLIVPCKGLDPDFQKNITSFFEQDHENYLLWFVVGDKTDPAWEQLCELKEKLSSSSNAKEVRIFIAGEGQSCSQKVHNLLYCCERIADDVENIAFADSDICVKSNWLSHLVWPIREHRYGVASGYRWFVPQKNNSATLALSAMNGKIAQLLGNTRFNQPWGGSMAIRTDVFRRAEVARIWQNAPTDDLTLGYAVRNIGMGIAFVPGCLVASHETTTWPSLFEFGRRQFLITRVTARGTWWFGLCASLYSVLGMYVAAAMAVYAASIGSKNMALFTFVPALFIGGQFFRAILRQKMIAKILSEHVSKMKYAMVADILCCCLWSPILLFLILASACGRTICWRGIRYKLISPTETIVVDRNK